MPVTKFFVGGFKSLRDLVEIPLAPVTLMFGPNSAGKTAAKEAWLELKRLLREAENFKVPTSDAERMKRWINKKDPKAFIPQGGEVNESADDHVVHQVLLGIEIEDLETEVSISSHKVGAGFALELYRNLQDRTIRYLLANDPDDVCAHLCLTVDGKVAILHSDFPSGMEQELITDEIVSDPRPLFASKPILLGVLHVDFSAVPFNCATLIGLRDRIFNLAKQDSNKWLAAAVQLDGMVLRLRINASNRRLLGWEEYFDPGFDNDFVVDPEISANFALINELADLINGFLHQAESALADSMEIGMVSGDRQRLKSADLVGKWPSRTSDPIMDGPNSLAQKYALALGARAAAKWNEVFLIPHMAPPEDDLVNDILAGGIFSPRNYKVRAELTENRDLVLASRNPELVGDETVNYRAALYLIDEQQRTLDFDQVGSGVSYVLPVLAALWGCRRSWIEQPELHLHPAAQCEMGDAIVRAFNRGRFSIIETHSEHLLLRILRRIRETSAGKVLDRELQCQPEAVAVLYFAPQADGSTQIHQLRVTRGGDFMDRWPDGFFEERSRELFDE